MTRGLYSAYPPGCLDHDAADGRSSAAKQTRASCRECKQIAKWWSSGEDLNIPQAYNGAARSPVREVAVAAFVASASDVDEWALARACERILVRHFGEAIKVTGKCGGASGPTRKDEQ